MPRPWDDDDDRDWSGGGYDDDPVEADDETEPTYPCPGCGQMIYEEADACPYCGEYLSFSDPHHASGRPWWVWLGLILALGAMIFSAGVLFW